VEDAEEAGDRMDAIASILEITIGCKVKSVNRMEDGAGEGRIGRIGMRSFG
jgi:hypothetical protein